jgi:glyoxylase-like metal-dependent hydrolase (beta-lactamase superfamily II)
MRTWQTKNGCRIIQVLSGRSNAYLIIMNDNIILADTGKKSSFAKLSRNLKSLNLTFADIHFLILTHTHFDHCQSARKIKELSNCRVIASEVAAGSIKNGYSGLPEGTYYFTKLITRIGRIIGKRKFGFEPFQPDIFVKGVYTPDDADCSIQIIETPGHSPDSVSILVDHEIALVGDAMFGIFKNSIFPPYSDDVVKMINSWAKLLDTECMMFLPGHGREIPRSLLQREYEKYSI